VPDARTSTVGGQGQGQGQGKGQGKGKGQGRRPSFNSVESEGGVPLLVFEDPVTNNRLSMQLQLVQAAAGDVQVDGRTDAPPKYCIINVDYHFSGDAMPAPLASPSIPMRTPPATRAPRPCNVLLCVVDCPHPFLPLPDPTQPP